MPGKPVPSYTLRLQVRSDLEKIWRYSFQTWGMEQADAYVTALVDRFDWLAENPQMGRNRDDIKKGYRCFPEGQHLVFYTVSDDLIDIIGIVHQRQDVSSHLTEW